MLVFATRRLLLLPLILFVTATACFFILRTVPGGPFDQERVLPPQIQKNIEAKYSLDRPLVVQYGMYMRDLVHGDLGPSFRYLNRSVNEIILQAFPVSMTLGMLGLMFALTLGVGAGVLAAVKKNTALDYGSMTLAMVGVSVPNFVLGPVLIIAFVYYLDWFPVAGWGRLSHLVLPAVVTGAPYAAYFARLARGGMLEVLQQDYIRTARAKGLPARTVIAKHALKSGLIPVVSFLGPATANLLSGSIVVEMIFDIPGLGTFFTQGALNRDYLLVIGVVLVFATLLLIFNLLVDLAYAWLDPRIRLE
ncbi:MAG: ABC transporter permease subunit [Acidobacteriota bacterium]|nr:MAG: ABC transporter permease subunit [Acidobacteriota bacterium]